ncbi:hypothetical protein B0H63DRAFT_120614 [Podospora didyma]|uniref:Extracellular membrane protein CFEM domain-containing protein n=1 Tax=Podospora didyma TaxID=330526 RepID=A0AAE0U4K5_9PEZI|nr:hypothetical protein B0H63DRAFT_120614 [Podospora didyma]
MRSTIPTSILLLASSVGAATPPSSEPTPECLRSHGQELAAAALCGDTGSLVRCFSHVSLAATPATLGPSLEQCLVNAGCTAAEAQTEAIWMLRRCDAASASDLRRRRDSAAGVGALPNLVGREPIITMEARQDAAAPTPAAAGTQCLTPSEYEIEVCPTDAAGKKGSCSKIKQSMDVCIQGKICHFDTQGKASCMDRQSNLGVAGTIIAIFFTVVIAASVFSICFLCCRERNVQKRLERAAEVSRIAKEAKLSATVAAKQNPASAGAAADNAGEDRQPLMAAHDLPPLPPMPQQYSGGYQPHLQHQESQDFGGQQNPFADAHDPHALR